MLSSSSNISPGVGPGVNNLQLASALGVGERELISLYGAGGKTTSLYLLAEELSAAGERVVITTTTMLFEPPDRALLLGSSPEEFLRRLGEPVEGPGPPLLARARLPEQGKLKGIEPHWPGRLSRELGLTVVAECDGADRRPLKGYASYEPVLPADSTLAVPILGLKGLGVTLNGEQVHRPGLFAAMAGLKIGETVGVEHLVRSMKKMIRRGRGQAPRARVVPLFTQVDLLPDQAVIRAVAAGLAGEPGLETLLFTALRESSPVRYIFNLASGQAVPEVSAVVLAAGFSRRMGRDKLTLPLEGGTVLGETLRKLAPAGVRETIVVLNPASAVSREQLGRLGVKVVVNEKSHRGIATSLQAGLAAVAPGSQGVIFVLGDQPLIPTAAYQRLLESYRRRLPQVAYPVYRGRRGNPVIFDRRCWSQLLELEGDRGGRQLFSGIPSEEILAVAMEGEEILLDLDTPGDYEQMLKQF